MPPYAIHRHEKDNKITCIRVRCKFLRETKLFINVYLDSIILKSIMLVFLLLSLFKRHVLCLPDRLDKTIPYAYTQ